MMDNRPPGALYMIGNAHLDPVWLWTWQEGFQEAKATFRSALDRLAESDDFLFTSSSAALYDWIEHNDPAMFEEIKQRVAEGRWEIVGGWWIQPDCNLPGGESFVRQGLYGQRYFQEKLGVTASVGYNVDSFGHAASLPQILRQSGMDAYVFMRPHPHEQRLPSRLFWWESDDGSRVLTFRIPFEYCTWGKELRQQVERCAAELRPAVPELMCFYGVGNHGGGPTRENIESIRVLSADPAYPRLVFSTPSRYFQAVQGLTSSLPVVHDELQHHASGCYAAHSGIKRWNRQAENALMAAEKMCSLANRVTGLPYPGDFGHAWRGVLFNQFHDILAGTSIEPAYDDARNLYGEALAIAARNQNSAVQSISWQVNIEPEEGMRPMVVFNPHSWAVCAPVELEVGRLPEGAAVIDAQGNPVPWQPVRSLATVASGSRNRICFLADLPAFGYGLYRLVSRPVVSRQSRLSATDTTLANSRFEIEFNPETGGLSRLYDKRFDFQWIRDEAAQALVLDDPSDTWSHGVLHYDHVVGQFKARAVRLIEEGPVKAVIRVDSEYGSSRLTQDFTLYADIDRIDVHVTIDWHERFKVLKLRFPVNLDFVVATYEIPYGVIQRPANGEEEPAQSWVDLSGVGRGNGRRLGLSVLNDGKYSFDVKEHEINLTVLRSPIYAHHVPYQPRPDGEYTFTDQGTQHFTYSLLFHDGSWEHAGTVQQALELNQPPIAQVESAHAGPLPARASYLSIDPPTVVATAVKRAEDNDDLILRCLETTGSETRATIDLPHWGRTLTVAFRGHEIKTLRVPMSGEDAVVETDLLEWAERPIPSDQ